MNKQLRKHLEKKFDCTIQDDDLILNYYSVDASCYQIRPQAVVFPNNENEIIQLVKFANKNNISITARGAGTGLVGSALGKGIILDLKNMNKIKILKKSVIVQPGTIKGILDKKLLKRKKFLAPNPSVGKYCSMGGMIGTNASGSHALKYGSVVDNMLQVTIIDGTGKKIKLPNTDGTGKQIFEIAKQIDTTMYPNTSKNSCGYMLNSVMDINHTHKVIAGSEGTLGIIVSAKFKILDIPKQKSLLVIAYDSEKSISNDLMNILKLNPAAVEYVDKKTIKNIKHEFPKNTCLLLFVEFDENVIQKVTKTKKIVEGKVILCINNKNQIAKWWNYRNLALSYSLSTISKQRLVPHVIEDSAVPVEKFDKLLLIIQKINSKYKTKTVMYGHAGNGNLHVRLVAKKPSKALLKNASAEFFKEILKLHGTITAEHGDGLARSEFVKAQYGSRNYKMFKKLKKILDPGDILNPDKIITKRGKMTRYLKW